MDATSSTFVCSIRDRESSIMSGGDGKLVQFHIPDSEFAESCKLELMKGQVLRVSVEIIPKEEADEAIRNDRKKRKPKRVVEIK